MALNGIFQRLGTRRPNPTPPSGNPQELDEATRIKLEERRKLFRQDYRTPDERARQARRSAELPSYYVGQPVVRPLGQAEILEQLNQTAQTLSHNNGDGPVDGGATNAARLVVTRSEPQLLDVSFTYFLGRYSTAMTTLGLSPALREALSAGVVPHVGSRILELPKLDIRGAFRLEDHNLDREATAAVWVHVLRAVDSPEEGFLRQARGHLLRTLQERPDLQTWLQAALKDNAERLRAYVQRIENRVQEQIETGVYRPVIGGKSIHELLFRLMAVRTDIVSGSAFEFDQRVLNLIRTDLERSQAQPCRDESPLRQDDYILRGLFTG